MMLKSITASRLWFRWNEHSHLPDAALVYRCGLYCRDYPADMERTPQMNRLPRHLRPKARRRLNFILQVISDGLGLAVLIFMAWNLVAIANEYLNGV